MCKRDLNVVTGSETKLNDRGEEKFSRTEGIKSGFAKKKKPSAIEIIVTVIKELWKGVKRDKRNIFKADLDGNRNWQGKVDNCQRLLTWEQKE